MASRTLLVAREAWLLEREEHNAMASRTPLVAREAWLLEREEHNAMVSRAPYLGLGLLGSGLAE
jgi:hypothetical protein